MEPAMNKVSLILIALMTLSLVIFMAPNVIALNHGKLLRNIALWLAIFLGLAFIYKTFGPGSTQPMFSSPEGTMVMKSAPQEAPKPNADNKAPGDGI